MTSDSRTRALLSGRFGITLAGALVTGLSVFLVLFMFWYHLGDPQRVTPFRQSAPRATSRRVGDSYPQEHRHLRARLDVLYFHLYRLSHADAACSLDAFPIVRRHDKAAFGHYRTKDMVLAYYNALAAGDTDVDVAT